jgi:hypothetical protein
MNTPSDALLPMIPGIEEMIMMMWPSMAITTLHQIVL